MAAIVFVAVPAIGGAESSSSSGEKRSFRFTWLPGSARAITRTDSPSRDTARFEFAYGPTAQASIGGEFGLVRAAWRKVSLHAGMYAMVALENYKSKPVFPPSQLWRGLVGVSTGISSHVLFERWTRREISLEATVVLGHESDHGDLADPQPPGQMDGSAGDFVAPDLAVRVRLPLRTGLVGRIHYRGYLHGDLRHVPGVELSLRWWALDWLCPTAGVFAERLFARDPDVANGHFVRGLFGLAIVGKLGEVTVFFSVDDGNAKGKMAGRRETRLSGGVRYAPF